MEETQSENNEIGYGGISSLFQITGNQCEEAQ